MIFSCDKFQSIFLSAILHFSHFGLSDIISDVLIGLRDPQKSYNLTYYMAVFHKILHKPPSRSSFWNAVLDFGHIGFSGDSFLISYSKLSLNNVDLNYICTLKNIESEIDFLVSMEAILNFVDLKHFSVTRKNGKPIFANL